MESDFKVYNNRWKLIASGFTRDRAIAEVKRLDKDRVEGEPWHNCKPSSFIPPETDRR